MKLSFTPLPHVSISLSSVQNSHSWQTPSETPSPHSRFTLFVASSAAHSTPLKPSPAHSVFFEGLGIEGRRRYQGWISKPGRVAGCAARQQCQTAEHDQHKERVIAAVTRLVRHITAFSEIHMRFYSTCTHTHFFFFLQWEWEKCIIELIVCNSLSDDENNNTIRPIRTVSVLWNWHFSWYIYCSYFWEHFLRHL